MGQRTRGIWCGGAECKVLISTYFTIRIDPLQIEEKWLFSNLFLFGGLNERGANIVA